jgi:hypothetical protein
MQAPGGDNTHVAQAETPCSTISQASGLQYMDSIGPSDPMERLHTNDYYVRQTALTNISNQIITGSCIIKPSNTVFSFYYLLLMSNIFEIHIWPHN